MFINGSAKTNISELDTTMLYPFELSAAPPSAAADVTKSFMISQTGIVTWVVDQHPYKEADVPIVLGNSSDGWLAGTTHHLPSNSTIDIIMNIANDSMDTVRYSGSSSALVRTLLLDADDARWVIQCICTVINSGSWERVPARSHTALFQMHLCPWSTS